MVTVAQELEYVLKYLEIQKIRMGDKLHFSMEIPEEHNQLKMPFMILQPIVNNAIDHGIYHVEEGKIRIFTEELEKSVLLSVEDNGVGMDQETIRKITEGSYDGGEKVLSNGIGLMNSDKRLIHQFGSEHRLQIQSIPGKGTRITIKIPKQVST